MGRNRRWRTAVVAISLSLLLAAPSRSDRRDQKAADLYTEATALIGKKKYLDAVTKLQAVLARGASEPNDRQGSQSRFEVYRYDPYYWLGVAFMELGEVDKALVNFGKSETYGVIRNWPEMHADLVRRRDQLEGRLVAISSTPSPAEKPQPGPTPVPSSIAAPEVVPVRPSPASPTVLSMEVHRTPATNAAPVPYVVPISDLAEKPGASTDPKADLLLLQREVSDWLLTQGLRDDGRAALIERQRRLAALVAVASGRPIRPSALSAERRALRERALPLVRRDLLETALEALMKQDWAAVDRFLSSASRADPAAPQIDLFRAVALGTRHLLEEKPDPLFLGGARAAIATWRKKVGAHRPLPTIVSPALRAVLQSD